MTPGTTWPTTRAGTALTFLAQVALAEVEGLVASPSALRGHLAFFADIHAHVSHASDFDNFRVLHVTSGVLERTPSPVPELPALAARGERALTVPTLEALEQLGIAVDADYSAVRERLGIGGHRLLGYGDFIQNMPLRSFEHATRTIPDRPAVNPFTKEKIVIRGRTLDGVPASVVELLCTPATWLSLLQLDTDPALGVGWGDQGRVWFLIREDDWNVQRFNRIWMREDCY